MSPALSSKKKIKGRRKGGRRVIGVTGSFSTGKTMAARFAKRYGALVIDADKLVHRIYNEEKSVTRRVREAFGRAVFINGKIDRLKLAKVAFGNRKNLKKLQKIVHPIVIKRIKKEVNRSGKSIVVIDAPLLIEANLHKFVDCVVVVKAAFKTQLLRGRSRGFSKKEILTRRAAQMPLRAKLKFADFIIENNGSKIYTERQVRKMMEVIKKEIKNG